MKQDWSQIGLLSIVAVVAIAALAMVSLQFARAPLPEGDSLGQASVGPTVRVGDFVTVDVLVTGAVDLAGIQTDVLYAGRSLSFQNVSTGSFGGMLFAPQASGAGTSSARLHNLLIVRPGPGAAGTVKVARLTFRALRKGTATLNVTSIILSNSVASSTVGSVVVTPAIIQVR